MLGNDTDADDDSLTAVLAQRPSHGTLSLDADGRFTYTPAANFQRRRQLHLQRERRRRAVGAGDRDPDGRRRVNDAPVAANDSGDDGRRHARSRIAVLANDTDVDGDALTVTSVGAPVHGTARSSTDGADHLHAGGQLHGHDSFTYTIGDGHGGSATATVAVTVTRGNDAPAAVNDAATTAEDTPVRHRGPGERQRSRRRHADGEQRRRAGARHRGGQRRTGRSPTRRRSNYNGPDSFTYTIGDGQGGSGDGHGQRDDQRGERRARRRSNDTATTAEDTAVDDRGAGQRQRCRRRQPVGERRRHGRRTASRWRTRTGRSPTRRRANYSGADSFTYTISDGQGGTRDGHGQRDDQRGERRARRRSTTAATTAEDTAVTYRGAGQRQRSGRRQRCR